MKCPNCGEEMADSALYCEHCGEDIHIVPDFEPELEQNIQQIISGIMEELEEPLKEEAAGGEPEEELIPEPEPMPIKRWKWLLPTILAVLILGAALGMGVWVYLHNSWEYQVNRAEQYAASGDYDKAISHYKRALELDVNNIELQFSLAEVYFLKNNKIEYEYLLREIARNENATMEQLDRAYGRLIAIYRAREDYNTINQLILGSENEQVISTYQNYIANPPEFSVIEGYYTSIQPLKLTAMGSGKIYFTMDGSDPDENSTQYTMPIILEKGEYVVKAVFVNDNGIYSEIVRKEYFIDNDDIPAPEISIVSGEYYVPVYIQVLDLDEDEEVYYTIDGTVPTYSSNRYTEPIPMPLGSSRFMFAKIVDGVTGDVAERNYVLVLNTENTPEQAVQSIREYVLSTGRILDETGHFDDSGAMYIYEYLYVANINEVCDCFVIAEVQRESDGTQVRTGNFYAVNVYDGTRYRLQRDERDRFILSALDGE
ncbi:MAG: chitobiase/beta-hexosaminidase C-terminal domain-containing protein [Acetatifactor sp.]|nr:chitobiase/beta-hexosaminidase C-terminal domain-containing protein [Acetatifactor sp.]